MFERGSLKRQNEKKMSFYARFSKYYEETFPMREEFFGFLKSYVKQKNTSVLDLGCGPGHYCHRFQQEGFQAFGIDLDQAMIEAARKRYPGIIFSCQDILDLQDQTESFNLIYSIGNVMAHIPKHSLDRLISAIHSKLAPNGYWIFQVVNWDYLLNFNHYAFPEKKLSNAKFSFHRRYETLSKKCTVFHMSMTSKKDVIFEEAFELYPVTAEEYLAYHHRYGFQLQGMYADFQKTTFKKEVNSGAVYVFRKSND